MESSDETMLEHVPLMSEVGSFTLELSSILLTGIEHRPIIRLISSTNTFWTLFVSTTCLEKGILIDNLRWPMSISSSLMMTIGVHLLTL